MKKEDADQLIRCVKECWWRGLLVLTIPSSFMAWAIYGWPITAVIEDGLAAWVQAFGSIAAIGGAYWIGKQQARFTENLRIERTRKAILGIGDLALERANLVAGLLSLNEVKLSDSDMLMAGARLMGEYHKSLSDGVISAIESIPFAEVGSAKAIAALQGLQLQFGFLDQAITNFNGGSENHEMLAKILKQLEPGKPEYIFHKEQMQEALRSQVRDRIKHIKRHYDDLVQSL